MAANHLVAEQGESVANRSWVVYLVAGVSAVRFLPFLAGSSWRGALIGLILAASLLVGLEAAKDMGVDPGLPPRSYSGRNRLVVQAARGAFAVLAFVLAVLSVAV